MNAHLVLTQVDDQLDCPAGEDPFLAGCLGARQKPEVTDEAIKGWPRRMGEVQHDYPRS